MLLWGISFECILTFDSSNINFLESEQNEGNNEFLIHGK